MAPLETTTKDIAGRAAMASASRANTPASLASVLDPILTTTRRARVRAARGSAMALGQQIVEGRVEAAHEPLGHAGHEAEQAVDERGHRVALVVDDRGLLGEAGVDGERARQRPLDRLTNATRLVDVDAHGPL